METVLLILGALGLILMVTVLYVFLVAARNFVSEAHSPEDWPGDQPTQARQRHMQHPAVERRTGGDRRQQTAPVDFPFVDSFGQLVEHDRRRRERRGHWPSGASS